ncbi:hypothetical protein H4R35_003064 [Dimargaris xerosporica]|nr:hypothetical protein H4R35_003064 [Dimargaris xerosporica]
MLRVHYETSDDAIYLVKATLGCTILLAVVVLIFTLVTSDITQLFQGPLVFSTLLSYRTIFSLLILVWYLAYLLFAHLIHTNFDSPSERWRPDDVTGELHLWETEPQRSVDPSDRWRLCAPPAPVPDAHHALLCLAVPDPDAAPAMDTFKSAL